MEFTSQEQKDFATFQAYDFDNDKQFQIGLSSIPNNKDPKVYERAKIFYYTRTVTPLDTSRLSEWIKTNTLDSNESSDTPPPSIPFADVVGMIQRGEDIPGIRRIPDKINENAPSISTLSAPPKPWERK